MATAVAPVAVPLRSRVVPLLRSRLWSLCSGAGAVLCLAGGAHTGARWAGGAAIAVGITQQLAILGLARRSGRRQDFWVPVVPAAILTFGVGSWWWVHRDRRPDVPATISPTQIPIVLAVALLLVAIWLGRRLPTEANTLVLTRHLPGVSDVDPSPVRWTYSRAAQVLVLVLVLGFVGGGFALPPLVLLALAVLAAAGIAKVHAAYRPMRQHARQVAQALRALAPVFAMPYNGAATFHVGMWSPYLVRSGQPVIVVTTRDVTFDRVPAQTSLPVLYAPSGSDQAVATMLPDSLRAAFYVFNGSNGVFLRQRGIQHVFLQHGDSDKDTSTNPRSARYDTVVVSGQAGIDRFRQRGVDLSDVRFVIVGRPQTAGIRAVARPIADVEHPVVLYAPTWKGKSDEANYSSLLVGPQIIKALLDRGCTVVFRPHPAGRSYRPHAKAIAKIKSRLANDAKRTGRPHRWGADAEELSVADVANLSDAMVSDVSGIVTDYLQTLKPYAMVATRMSGEAFRTRYPTSQAAYVIEGDLSNLGSVLADLLSGDPLAPLREERRRYYLAGFDGDESEQIFAAFVQELVASRPATDRRPSVSSAVGAGPTRRDRPQ